MIQISNEEIYPNIKFHSISTDKFKTIKISIKGYVPLEKDTVYLYSLLSKILLRSCKKYPDFTSMSKKLSSLYGASLSSSVSKVGDRLALSFTTIGIDDRYTIDDEKLSTELTSLLCDIIFDPNIDNNLFSDEDVKQSKREVIDAIDAQFNEKRSYAIDKAISIMCEDEAYGISKYGSKEDIEKASSADIYSIWKKFLKSATFEIYFTGETGHDFSKVLFKNKFQNIERENITIKNEVIRNVGKVKEESETMGLSQSKMILGFRADCAVPDDDIYTAKLMTAILGGTAHSKFFLNVREKLSLCYYCAARFDKHKGIMLVDAGIEKDNIEKTKDAILNEIEELKNGNVTDFEIDATKMSIVNAYKESLDLSSSVESWYSSQVFDKEMISVEKACEIINSITKEDIIKAANKLKLDTIYTLVGEGE